MAALIKNFSAHDYKEQIVKRCNQLETDLIGDDTYRYIPWHKVHGKRRRGKLPTALAIAHVDTVFADRPAINKKDDQYSVKTYKDAKGKTHTYRTNGNRLHKPRVFEDCIFSGALDDRLGVAIILDILPKILPSFRYDVLLTTDEEIGRSTAQDWCYGLTSYETDCAKDNYQFIFEFDRAGTDVVTYDYYNAAAEDLLEDSGWHIGQGAFTDICYVDDLKIWAANFGCGYHNQHSNDCYVDLHELDINLRRFAVFLDKLEDTFLLDQPRKYGSSSGSIWGRGGSFYDNEAKYVNGRYVSKTDKVVDKNDTPADSDKDCTFYADREALQDLWNDYANTDDDDFVDVDDDCSMYIGENGEIVDNLDVAYEPAELVDSPTQEDFNAIEQNESTDKPVK